MWTVTDDPNITSVSTKTRAQMSKFMVRRPRNQLDGDSRLTTARRHSQIIPIKTVEHRIMQATDDQLLTPSRLSAPCHCRRARALLSPVRPAFWAA